MTLMLPFDGTRVKRLWQRELASCHEFASALGVSKSSLYRWETGQQVPVGSALKALNLIRVHGIDWMR
jgi:DNA-binding transcriptional regulator YiaG